MGPEAFLSVFGRFASEWQTIEVGGLIDAAHCLTNNLLYVVRASLKKVLSRPVSGWDCVHISLCAVVSGRLFPLSKSATLVSCKRASIHEPAHFFIYEMSYVLLLTYLLLR